jgi:tetratricopeptide (TPR) repeat protein
VREAIGAQLSRLSPTASNLLAAAAVLGGGTFEQLVRVAGMEEGEGLSALDEALASRLIRESTLTNEDDTYYAFSHDKVRDVAYTEAGAARRRVFHRRALEMLEEEAGPAMILARHALAAKEPESAFGHLLAAGDAAMAVFATEDALGHYEQARGLLGGPGRSRGSLAPPPTRELEHLHVNLGRARELAGEWEEAQGIYEEMLSRAREIREPRLEWAALNRLAILAAQRRFDMGRAKALIQESLQAAEAGGDRAILAETEWNLAQMAAMRWEPEVALSYGERALGLAREAGLEELEARSLFVLGQAHRFAGRWEECVACASRATALYEALGGEPPHAGTLAAQFIWAGAPPSKELANRAMEALSLTLLAIGELNRGFPKDVVEAARRALRIGREIDNDWAQTNATVLLGYGLWETGEYGEALRVARLGLDISHKVRHPAASFMLTVLGSTLGAMLNLEEAHPALLEALAGAGAKLPRPWKTTAISKLCANGALAGDWEAAHRHALEATAIRNAALAGLIGFDFYRHDETEALLRGGDGVLAREDVRRLGEHVGQNRRFRLVHLRMLAVLDRWDGYAEGAIGHLQEAVALAEEIGLPGELWQIEASVGELHEERGEPEKARGAFSRARAIVRKLADKIGDAGLRSCFLGVPQVRRVLDR